jgi:hypothetical protein
METIFTSIKNLILESNLTTNKNLIMKKNITTKTFAYLLLKGYFLASKNGLIYLMLIFSLMSQGQSVGDYRTKATGNWNATTTWETWNGSAWVQSGTPNSSNGVISILDVHTVTVTASVTVDQVVIESGGQLTLDTSTLTIANGSGVDMIVNGTLRQTATNATYITINSGAELQFGDGGRYQQQRTSAIPSATWHVNSTCEIYGITNETTAITNIGQSFGNFEWNCTGQINTREFVGSVPSSINGKLIITSTGSGVLSVSNSSTALSLTVGNLEVMGGTFVVGNSSGNASLTVTNDVVINQGNFFVAGTGASNTHTLTVNGNLNQTGGNFEVCRTNNAGIYNATINGGATFSGGITRVMNNSGTGGRVAALTIVGNTTISGGTLDLSATGATNAGRLFLKGNFIQSGGNLQMTSSASSGSSGFYFEGTGTQTVIFSGGTQTSTTNVLNRFFYKTTSGPTALNETYSGSSAQNTITGSTGTPASGYAAWPTSGTLIKNLTINNPAGVTLSTAKEVNTTLFLTNGALSGSPALTYASGAILHYNGTGAITTTEKEFPSSNGPTNLVVSNSASVTLHASRMLSGNLTVNNSGVLNLGSITLNRATSGGMLTLGDDAILRIGGTGSFPTNYTTHSIAATSTVNYNGANQQVLLLNSSQSYGNLTLSGSGTKTFANATDTNVRGNFITEGVTVTAPTKLNFNGTTAQSIAGLAYNNIAFSNAGTKTFSSNSSVSPTSAITFSGTPGTVDFDGTSDNLIFILKSDNSGTASVADASGWSLIGKVTTERFIPSKRTWRLLTAPLKGTSNTSIFSNWQGTNNEGVLLWGPQGTTTPSSSNTGMYQGPQANVWSYNNSWIAVTNTNTTSLFNNEKNNAFIVFATGPSNSTNIASGQAETTLKPKGELITGSTQYNTLTTNQYHLIGNPYASPLNTVSLKTSNPNFTFWLLDPSLGNIGGYYTYDGNNWTPTPPNGSSGQPDNTYIQSGQGFFVRSSSATSFTISESHKVAGNSNTWFNRNATDTTADKIRLLLYKQINNEWQLTDGILAVNSAIGNNDLDATDTEKMSNFNENMGFRYGTSTLAIEYRGLPTLTTIQPMRLTGTTVQPYQIRVKTENYSNSTLQPYLEDTQSGTLTEIPIDGSEVVVSFTGVASTASNPDTRFRIVYSTELNNEEFTSTWVSLYPNPVCEGLLNINLKSNEGSANFVLNNLLGQVVHEGVLDSIQNTLKLPNLEEGFYLISVKQNNNKITSKIYIK